MALEGFKDAWALSTVRLFRFPKSTVDGECYFDRKQRYSVNAQAIFDDRRHITAFFCGWSSTCSGITVYGEILLPKTYKPHFFCLGQFVVGDSAYPVGKTQNTLVPAYRFNMK